MLDWNTCPAVERTPERVSGAWVFKGTRVPVRALFENLEILGQVHPKGKEITLKTALQSVSIPLHPGAEKFYKEKGLLK